MTIDEAIQNAVNEFEKAISHLKTEFAKLQVGRANSSLIENLSVEVYGSNQPLKGIASISVPDPRTLQIQPWDKSSLGDIEKAISTSDLGLNPTNDGVCIRIAIPALTEERRMDLTKHVHKLAEEARISVRNSRQDAHNSFKTMKNDGDLTEDDLHSADKKLQEKVDKFNEEVDELARVKEQDIMTV